MRCSRESLQPALRTVLCLLFSVLIVQGAWGQNRSCLEVEPDSLEFYGNLCDGWLYQESIEYQPIYIFAVCGDTGYYWEISADQPWVAVTPWWGWDSYSASVWIDKEQLIAIVPDSLLPGDTLRLEAVVTVTAFDPFAPPQTVVVSLLLDCSPPELQLMVDPPELFVEAPSGDTLEYSFYVYQTQNDSVWFDWSNSSNWLNLPTTNAPLPAPNWLNAAIITTGLAPGIYHDTIFIAGYPDSAAPPFQTVAVPVTLEVTDGSEEYVVQTAPSEFNVILSQGEGAVDSLHVFEIHGDTVPFMFYNTQPWLVVDPSWTPPYMTPTTLMVLFSTYGLAPGTYDDTIVVCPIDPDFVFDTVRVPVTVTIHGGPVLIASPDHFEITVPPGGVAGPHGFFVYETHGDSVPFAADVVGGSPWLHIEETNPYNIYVTPDSVFFSIFADTLPQGIYADTILLWPPWDSIPFPPVAVPVWLMVDTGGYQLVVEPQSFNYTVPMDHFFYDYLHIDELHGQTLLLNFSNTQPWLILPMILVLPPTPMTLEFGISTDSLPPGTYNDVITIYGYADNSQPPVDVAHVPVWLTVTEGQPFVVRAAPDHFEYMFHQGAHSITDQFLVYDLDSANLPFAVTTVNNSDWLEIDTSTTSGVTPSHVYFHVNTAGLAPGSYGDSVLIYYPLDDMYGFDDVLVPVILHILSDTLDAIVATEPESFNFVLQQGENSIDELYVYEIHGGTVPFMMWNQTSWLDFGFCLTVPLITPCTSPFVVNTDSLDPGNYFDTITIWPDTDGVSFPPVYVPVTLTVLPSGSTPADSLIIPGISVLPCDWECVVQPVQTKLSQPIKGATIPISIPDGVEICSLSTSGLITEGWDWTFSEVNDSLGYVFMALANSYNAQIPVGVTSVFNIYFYVAPECRENLYFRWDTTLMLSFSKHLAYTDTTYTTVNPGFNMFRDSVEVRGYTPGSFDGEPQIDISDLVAVVDYMFTYGPPPCVINALDVNGDCMGPDISDLVALIDYMFVAWDPPPEFPPELSCGCITDDGNAVAKLNPDITVSAVYQDGNTVLILSSPVDLRGLQLELRTVGDPGVQKLTSDELDLVHGESNGLMRVGILDLDGADVIAAGETPVVRLSGEVEIVNAVVTDGRHVSMAAVVSGSGDGLLPGGFSLGQNYPNPFNPVTAISFSLPQPSQVTLEVFNITGQKVATLVDGPRGAGEHTISWDAREMSSGVYFYKLTTPESSASRKMVLLK